MNNIKALVLATLLAISSLSFASGSNIARMNAGVGDMSLTTDGVEAVYTTAKARPGLEMMLTQTLGQEWQGNLEVVDSWIVPVGTTFINSGLDKRGVPTQWEQVAKKSFRCFQIRNRVSHKTILIKDNCLNPVNRIPAVPLCRRELIETSNVTEVDFDLAVEVNIDFKPTVTSTATATASTAPINITINNTQAAAPLMMAGSAPANQFVVFRDARNYLSLGWLVGGGTKINVSNTNINMNQNQNSNENTNVNTNSNSNANTNTVNVGGGCGEPQPFYLSAEVGIMPTPQLFSDNKYFYFYRKVV